jgi:ribonuclease J
LDKLKVGFLGGVGEIGKNMTVLTCGDDIIVIDAGLAFPNDELPGVDLVIPDIAYLINNADKIRGIFITHGHEDHIGALPFILKMLDVPVYASQITLAILENKFKEHKLEDLKLNTVSKGSVIKAGSFTVEFIKVSHSVAGSFALAVNTPIGMIFHTGDFKIDYNPIDGEMMDLQRISEIGKRGVLLLMAESTNIEREGYSMSESTVGTALNTIFAANVTRRIIIATFASNIHRLQQIIDLAVKYGRKVAFSGRSMLNICEVAQKIGALKFPPTVLMEVEKVTKFDQSKVVIITTGSQGEPMSALTRMASGDFNKVTIGENDTIIISASPIPGNERMIYNVINNLYRMGAQVVYDALADVHVSGHACREELKLIHALTKPKFFIPVHGEYRHLSQHAQMAIDMGQPAHTTFIADIGNQVILTRNSMKKCDNLPAGVILVDGTGVGDMGSSVLRDRKRLSEEGVLIAVIQVDTITGALECPPDIISRGLAYNSESEELAKELRRVVTDALQGVAIKKDSDKTGIKDIVRKALRSYLMKKLNRSPMILPIIIES